MSGFAAFLAESLRLSGSHFLLSSEALPRRFAKIEVHNFSSKRGGLASKQDASGRKAGAFHQGCGKAALDGIAFVLGLAHDEKCLSRPPALRRESSDGNRIMAQRLKP